MIMKIRHIAFSEKGQRMNNEDCYNVVRTDDGKKMFIVCDGMGGHACGEVASKTVCDSISVYWEENLHEPDTIEKAHQAAKRAQSAIDEVSGHYQMGTTMVMASIDGQNAMIAHAGDSRCYVIDLKGNVKYRTTDHLETGTVWIPYINRAFFTRHPEQAVPDVKLIRLQPLDRILLCSDGLYNSMDDKDLLHLLQCAKDVEQVAEKYQAICKEKAGDNYTAIIIEVE